MHHYIKKQNNYVDLELPQGDCRKEHKEKSQYKHMILTDGGCENQREFIDGSLNYERVHDDGCSKLYVGDIEIRFESVSARKHSHEHEDEDLVEDNEEPGSTFP